MGLDRKAECWGLHVPPARDPAQLAREDRSSLRRYVLDHAVGIRNVEVVVVKRQTLGRIRAHERTRVLPIDEVDARDVELRS
jgi:hypothetical protein